HSRRRHQCPVRERYPQPPGLRAADQLTILARGLVPRLAVRAGMDGGEERADDELAWLHRPNRAPDLLDDTAVFVSERRRRGHRLEAAIRPQVRSADAGRRDSDDGVGRLHDLRLVALLESHIARPIEN